MPRTSAMSLLAAATVVVVGLSACSSSGSADSAASAASATSGGTGSGSVAATASASASLASPSVGSSPVVDGSGTVTFAGVTVGDATKVGTAPKITASSAGPAPGLLVQDLVVGTGAPAASTSQVSVYYSGVLYADGTPFDSNFGQPQPAQFPLDGVVPGFAQGIGGTAGVEPMRIGGRRLLVFPAALGYGDAARGPIPAGASLVFVIDLVGVS